MTTAHGGAAAVVPVGVHGGCPTWFRALARTVRRGGRLGYQFLGFQLGQHLDHEVPHSLDDSEWRQLV